MADAFDEMKDVSEEKMDADDGVKDGRNDGGGVLVGEVEVDGNGCEMFEWILLKGFLAEEEVDDDDEVLASAAGKFCFKSTYSC